MQRVVKCCISVIVDSGPTCGQWLQRLLRCLLCTLELASHTDSTPQWQVHLQRGNCEMRGNS
jgi:hypothetical protein